MFIIVGKVVNTWQKHANGTHTQNDAPLHSSATLWKNSKLFGQEVIERRSFHECCLHVSATC